MELAINYLTFLFVTIVWRELATTLLKLTLTYFKAKHLDILQSVDTFFNYDRLRDIDFYKRNWSYSLKRIPLLHCGS